MRKYLLEYGVKTEDLPHILTISEFMGQIARKTEAGRIDQIFTLYNAYLEVIEEKSDYYRKETEFEAFRGWGELLLSDFNTVDLYMADPSEIFKNVKDYREIATDYLSEDQKEVMKEYFGIEGDTDHGKFWKNFEKETELSNLKKEFLNLWQILFPLHKKFIKKLKDRGLGTTGSIYKEATLKLQENGREAIPYRKVIAIGFNALSEAERRTFKVLENQEGYPGYENFIDFIWDSAGPILESDYFRASRFVDYNKKHFPSPEWIEEILQRETTETYPEITIISSPTNTAQTKVAGEILEKFRTPEGHKIINDAEVALVLPDETLLPNMIFSIPDDLGDINLTMGISLRQTPIASFMALLRRLFSGFRETKQSKLFYIKDLRIFSAHPYSSIIMGEESKDFLDFLKNTRKVTVSLSEIESLLPSIKEVFDMPAKKKTKLSNIFKWLYSIFDILEEKISINEEKKGCDEDLAQIKIYREYINELEEALNNYKITPNTLSLLQMIEKSVASEKIGFEGEPLRGLQVMGTLETRTLDFRHVIILSMNEGIMPRKAVANTFIPETLRKEYGLPPARYTEEIFGYYFYRLISRAETVTLIYDGRIVTGLRGGISRYLLQLKQYVPKDKVKEEHWQYRLQSRKAEVSTVEKNEKIKNLLENFSSTDELRKNLSASSLNSYRECQVKFFLQNILNLTADPERGEFMDAITIGDVLHEVMMDLYMPQEMQKMLLKKPIVINPEYLQEILDHPEIIENLTIRKIKKIYYRDNGEGYDLESGVSKIIAEEIVQLVKTIVEYDKTLAPFRLYGCEISRNIRVTLSTGRTVNFRFAIDRLDEIEIDGKQRLRIVDYKTGARKRRAESLEEVFAGGYGSEQIFQLFTYAWLLDKTGMEGSQDVMTEIYYVPDLINKTGGLPEIAGEKVTSYSEYSQEFSDKLENMVESIFESRSFEQTKDAGLCEYCGFKTYCSR